MADRPSDPLIAAHIESISSRTDPETRHLIAAILRPCWPGDSGDRSEPGALEWVRRWGPRRAGPVASACSCAVGRCRVCN